MDEEAQIPVAAVISINASVLKQIDLDRVMAKQAKIDAKKARERAKTEEENNYFAHAIASQLDSKIDAFTHNRLADITLTTMKSPYPNREFKWKEHHRALEAALEIYETEEDKLVFTDSWFDKEDIVYIYVQSKLPWYVTFWNVYLPQIQAKFLSMFIDTK